MNHFSADRCKVPQAFWAALRRGGISPSAVLRQARLPAILMHDTQAFVSTSDYFALWRAVDHLAPEPGFGIRLIAQTDTAWHPPAMMAPYFAADYREGLQRMARFKRLCTPETLTVREDELGCSVEFEWTYADEPAPSITTDITFASLIELGRRGTGRGLTPRLIELAGGDDARAQRKAFFGCTVVYGAARDRLHLRKEDLDRPFPGYDPELLAAMTPALASALADLEAGSVSCQVKQVLTRRLPSGRPEIWDVAREMGMSDRTLQRRITQAGTTFRQLLLQARLTQARELLRDPRNDIAEVAYLLGYQDTSSFYRAFRDQEGTTPARWRKANLSAGIPTTTH